MTPITIQRFTTVPPGTTGTALRESGRTMGRMYDEIIGQRRQLTDLNMANSELRDALAYAYSQIGVLQQVVDALRQDCGNAATALHGPISVEEEIGRM